MYMSKPEGFSQANVGAVPKKLFANMYFFHTYVWEGGKQWQPTPKNLPRMQCARAISVA